MTMPRRRTKARELALQFLYQLDVRGADALNDLDAFLDRGGTPDDVREFANELVRGCHEIGRAHV